MYFNKHIEPSRMINVNLKLRCLLSAYIMIPAIVYCTEILP